MLYLILANGIGIGLRSGVTFLRASASTRWVHDAGTDSTGKRKHAEHLLIAQLAEGRAKLHNLSHWAPVNVDLDPSIEPIDHTNVGVVAKCWVVDRDLRLGRTACNWRVESKRHYKLFVLRIWNFPRPVAVNFETTVERGLAFCVTKREIVGVQSGFGSKINEDRSSITLIINYVYVLVLCLQAESLAERPQ